MVSMWSFHLRAVLTLTSNSLKEETCSIVTPLYCSGRHDSLNLAGAITISLVFFQLIFIKLDSDHLLTELRWFWILDCSLLRVNSLLNPFQSAYTKFYTTETTLLSLNDHISNVISMQQVSCLCLLYLSAAFDTLEHSILLHCLSTWFGISSVSLQ